jgi:hypothetical protein
MLNRCLLSSDVPCMLGEGVGNRDGEGSDEIVRVVLPRFMWREEYIFWVVCGWHGPGLGVK